MDHNPRITELVEGLRLVIPSGFDAVGYFGCWKGCPVATKGEEGLAEPTDLEVDESSRASFIDAMEELRSLLPPDKFMWDEQDVLNGELRATYGVTHGPYSEVVVHRVQVPAVATT